LQPFAKGIGLRLYYNITQKKAIKNSNILYKYMYLYVYMSLLHILFVYLVAF